MSFSFKKKRGVGIDVSELSVKIIGLEQGKTAPEIVFWGKEDIAKDVVLRGEIKNEQALAEVIQKLLSNLKGELFKFKKVAISLPEEKSFVDVIKAPVIEDKEKLMQVISFEAESIIPIPLKEVYFDFEKVETTAKLTKCQEVVISACPQKIVDSYFNVFSGLGLSPVVMEVESFSVVRALTEKNFFSSPFLLVDFGETRTTLAVFSGKNLRFTSTINTSSGELTKRIAESMGISLSSAEDLKIKEGMEGKQRVLEIVAPFLNDLAGQISHYIDYYRSYSAKCQEFDGKKTLNRVVLCGGGSYLKGLSEFLANELKVEVEKANPLLNLSNENTANGFNKNQALGYATAIGLALKTFYGE